MGNGVARLRVESGVLVDVCGVLIPLPQVIRRYPTNRCGYHHSPPYPGPRPLPLCPAHPFQVVIIKEPLRHEFSLDHDALFAHALLHSLDQTLVYNRYLLERQLQCSVVQAAEIHRPLVRIGQRLLRVQFRTTQVRLPTLKERVRVIEQQVPVVRHLTQLQLLVQQFPALLVLTLYLPCDLRAFDKHWRDHIQCSQVPVMRIKSALEPVNPVIGFLGQHRYLSPNAFPVLEEVDVLGLDQLLELLDVFAVVFHRARVLLHDSGRLLVEVVHLVLKEVLRLLEPVQRLSQRLVGRHRLLLVQLEHLVDLAHQPVVLLHCDCQEHLDPLLQLPHTALFLLPLLLRRCIQQLRLLEQSLYIVHVQNLPLHCLALLLVIVVVRNIRHHIVAHSFPVHIVVALLVLTLHHVL